MFCISLLKRLVVSPNFQRAGRIAKVFAKLILSLVLFFVCLCFAVPIILAPQSFASELVETGMILLTAVLVHFNLN